MEIIPTIERSRHAVTTPRLVRLLPELPLAGLLLTLLIGSMLLYRLPFQIPVRLGQGEGLHNDAPFIHGFNTAERTEVAGQQVAFRWSTRQASIRFPNLPTGVYLFTTNYINGGPGRLEMAGHALQLAATQQPRHIVLLLPNNTGEGGLTIEAARVQAAPGDPRELGIALSGGQLSTIAHAGLLPPWAPLLAGALPLCLSWLAIRLLGGSPREALLVGSLLLAALLAAIAVDPLRVGLAPQVLLLACLCCALALLSLGPVLSAVRRRLAVPLENPWRRWLLLATAAVFALALAGRFFPASMHGDIGFHRNRMHEVLQGMPLLISLHRGIHFPYPPALYILLAPLSSLAEIEIVLQISAAAFTAFGLPALFFLVRYIVGSDRAALFAALLYGLFPATYMPIWWSFDTHIFAQWTGLMFSAYLVWNWARLDQKAVWLGLLGWLLLIFLGHFGFFINVSLLSGLLVVLGWLRWPERRRQMVALALALVLAEILVWLLFYSAYLDLLSQHMYAFADGGMNEVNDRPATPRLKLLQAMLVDGLWRHYAVLPVLLAPLGLALLVRGGERIRPLVLVIGATFAVSLALAGFPLINASTITTRWLMFSAWALAVCAGVALNALWQRGGLPRLVASGTLIFVGWWGIRLWLLAMAYYVRPPEPF